MKTFLTSLILVVLLLGCLLLILLFSPFGLKTAITLNNHFTNHPLHYRTLHGNITGPIRIEGLKACSNKGCATADQLYFSWSPGQLFFGHFAIDSINLNHLTLQEATSQNTAFKKAIHTSQQKKILTFSINNLTINQLTLHTRTQHTITAEHIALHAIVHPNDVSIKAYAHLTQPYTSQYYVKITGKPTVYNILLDAQGNQSHLQWQGTGNQQGFQIHNTANKLSQGHLQSQLQYQWSPTPSWKIDFDAQNIQLNQWNSDWPSPLSLTIHSQGSLKKQQPQITFNVQGHTPKTSLALSGEVHKTVNIQWNLHSQSLAELTPKLTGTINTTGKITGPYLLPTIKASLSTTQFHFHNIGIRSLNTNALIDLSQQQPSSLSLTGTQLDVFGYVIKALSFKVNGNLLSYQVYTEITHVLGTLSSSFKGTQHHQTWGHQIQTLQFDTLSLGQWKLTHPSTISTATQHIDSEPLCFALSDSPTNQTCMDFHWQPNRHWSSSINSHGTRLTPLTRNLLPPHTQLSGTLDLDATVSGKATHIQAAEIKSAIHGGELTYREEKQTHTTPIQTAQTHWLYKKHTLTTDTNIELEPDNHIIGKISIHNLPTLTWPTANQSISGSLSIKAQHLNAYSAFIPNVDLKNGSLESTLTIKGPINTPNLTGHTALSNIQVFLPKMGLTISNINFDLVNRGHKTTYNGAMYSNKKPMHFNGETQYKNNNWLTRLRLNGKNFQLINNHEYQVFISPDLQFTIKNKDISVNGNINIPQAKITPYQAKNVKRLPHSDIQYQTGSTKNPWIIHGDVNVQLGKQIDLSIIGIRGQAQGNIQISKKPQSSTLCNGHISINGVYEAYGHKLTISPHSELTYNNNPLTNPTLNLRATKKISNANSLYQQDFSTTGVTVGIEVTGMLNHPILSLFSVPANLSQSDILSYLILGHLSTSATPDNINQQSTNSTANIFDTIKLGETGLSSSDSGGISTNVQNTLGLSELGVETSSTVDAAGNQLDQQNYFVLGKFISPNVYVRYSQGLMDNNDIVQFRLFLTPQWILQTESNSLDNSNGIDILYTIER